MAIWLIGYIIGRNHKEVVEKVVTNVETIVKYDTIRIESPAEVKYEVLTKTIRVPVYDTLRIHDTLYMSLPTHRKAYKEDTYYLEISGYNPNLDYIEVYPRTVTITKTETVTRKPSPWYYSVDVALNYGQLNRRYIEPEIGAEIGYKKFSIGAEAGLNVELRNGAVIDPYLCWRVKAKYNILGR